VLLFGRLAPNSGGLKVWDGSWSNVTTSTAGNFEGNVPGTDGGCVDNPFRWCDNLSNNDPKVLTFMSKGFANMVVQMAFDTTVLGSSGTSAHKPALSVQAKAGRGASPR
jgi:hypothetical protein